MYISWKEFEEESIINNNYVKSVLAENGIPTDSKFTKAVRIPVDFDNDAVEEQFYIITNVFPMDFTPEKVFSFVFMVKDNKIYYCIAVAIHQGYHHSTQHGN